MFSIRTMYFVSILLLTASAEKDEEDCQIDNKNAICNEFPKSLPVNVTLLMVKHSDKLMILDVTNLNGSGSNVHTINMKAANLAFIEGGVFELFPDLEIVRLSYNKLDSIDSALFRSCHNLKDIYLDHNNIQLIAPDSFEHLEKLATLDLSNNIIISVPIFPTTLTTLKLSYNSIQFINEDAFKKAVTLQHLDICGNSVLDVNFLATFSHNLYSSLMTLCTPLLPYNNTLNYYSLRVLEIEAQPGAFRPNITGNTLRPIKSNNFEYLVIMDYHIQSGAFLAPISGQYNRLKSLSLINVTIDPNGTNEFLRNLAMIKSLEQLNFRQSPMIVQAVCEDKKVWENLEQLKHINMAESELKKLGPFGKWLRNKRQGKIVLDIRGNIIECTSWRDILKDDVSVVGNVFKATCFSSIDNLNIPVTQYVAKDRDDEESEPNLNAKNNTTIGIVIAVGLLISIMFTAAFFYFRRGGQSPAEEPIARFSRQYST